MMKPNPKTKRIKSKKYLDFLKKQPCCVGKIWGGCFGDIVPAHQTIRIPESVKGTAQKDHDIWALPICEKHHQDEHTYGIKSIWEDIDRPTLITWHLINYSATHKTPWGDGEFHEWILGIITREWDK